MPIKSLAKGNSSPGPEKHGEIRADFKAEIDEFAQRVEKKSFDEEKVREFAAKVMTRLIMHVGREDQKIGEFILAGGKSDEN
ncbi:MAG: hypothetical protein GX335_09170 [Firmicutes bacterium]|nr:hypothetical protein [Bacillota bacterium]